MSAPIFMQVTPELHGAIVAGVNSGFVCSVFHAPTGEALCGFEPTYERAVSWIESARIIFAQPEGRA